MNKGVLSRFAFLLVLATLLAACAGQPAVSQPSTIAQQPVAAAAATSAPAMPSTGGNANAAPVSAGGKTYVIVPDQSQASYEVQEKFMNRDLPNQAIGKTTSINGQVVVDLSGKPTASIPKMEVDLRTLQSDQSRRDQRIHSQWLESDKYPLATFVSTGITGGPDSYTAGQEVTFKLNGNLTIHDTTKPVTFDVKAKLNGDTLTGTATTQVMMVDFGFNPPDIAGMLTVKDGVTITVNFTAKQQN